ncbi:MAG: dihydrofolate reductase family protein [Solirubrobacterales bacterium]
MRRLFPDPAETTVAAQLDGYRPWEEAPEGRPRIAVNFATTLDGRAAIGGVSGPVGSATDTEMLVGLRSRFDAVLIGAGTMRAERYGRFRSKPADREARVAAGLPADPLLAIVSGHLDLPWEAPAFTEAEGGDVLVLTSSAAAPPELPAPPRIVRHERFVDVVGALRRMREEGVRAVLCEGGPGLHDQLQGAGFVDDLFLTIAPKLAGGEAPRILEGDLPGVVDLELSWLLQDGSELLARYRRR